LRLAMSAAGSSWDHPGGSAHPSSLEDAGPDDHPPTRRPIRPVVFLAFGRQSVRSHFGLVPDFVVTGYSPDGFS
jgi:hypothetical protein